MGTVSKTLNIVANTTYNLAIDLWAWSIWATEAGITTTYSSLANLLADEKAVRQLMTVHKSVDYLANYPSGADRETLNTIINNDICAKWINLSDYALDTLSANSDIKSVMDEADKYGYGEWACNTMTVPKLASNSQDGYNATASESNSRISSAPWKAFDRNDSTNWSTNDGSSSFSLGSKWLKIELPTAKSIGYIHLKARAGKTNNTCLFSYQLLGSTDNVTYENLTGVIGDTTFSTDIKEWNVKTISTKPYKYIKVNVGLANSGGLETYATIQTLDLYTWGPLGNVPIMTANNAPFGTVSYSAQATSYDAYKAFSSENRGWFASNSGFAQNAYIAYEAVNPFIAKRAKVGMIITDSGSQTIYFKIQGSNDGFSSDIHDLCTEQTLTASTPNTTTYIDVDLEALSAYKSHRLIMTRASSGGISGLGLKLQFYGRELKPLVPTMTANDKPKGKCIRNSVEASTYEAWKAFNGDRTSGFWAEASPSAVSFLGYIFERKTKIDGFIINASHYDALTSMKLQGSDNTTNGSDGTWTDILTVSSMPSNATNYVKMLDATENYKAYRMYFNKKSGTTYTTNVYMFQFYGMDYSEKEFAQGSTRKTIYDHGVELVTVQSKTIGSGAVATKEANQLYTYISTTANSLSVWLSGQDVSGYNYLCGKIGNKAQESDYIVVYDNIPSSFAYGSAYQSLLNGLTAMLDISQYTGTKYVGLYVGHANAGTVQFATIKELWLE